MWGSFKGSLKGSLGVLMGSIRVSMFWIWGLRLGV